MSNNFRNINYGTLLYETLRNYFSINSSGELSILYRFLLAIIMPLQAPFNNYQDFRTKEAIIASCKWQIGQLTNVLNYLYDSVMKRIFITQSVIVPVVDPMFAYAPNNFDMEFTDSPPEIFEVEFTDRILENLVTINIPSSVDQPDLVATVEQIRIQGIPYLIQIF